MRQGRYIAYFAKDDTDLHRAQRLRWLCFLARRQGIEGHADDAIDADEHDPLCDHVLIEDARCGTLVCCFRILTLSSGAEIQRTYSARSYDLSSLAAYDGRLAELGRFCIHPDRRDPDILRLAWAVLTHHVEQQQIDLLFGCSSFTGTLPEPYVDAFAMLRERHLAPRRWLPGIKARQIFDFARTLRWHRSDPGKAMASLPPLLRSYLLMGGWVSDHAVVDHQLDTLHVFTGLEINAIPSTRKRLLRNLVAAPPAMPALGASTGQQPAG